MEDINMTDIAALTFAVEAVRLRGLILLIEDMIDGGEDAERGFAQAAAASVVHARNASPDEQREIAAAIKEAIVFRMAMEDQADEAINLGKTLLEMIRLEVSLHSCE